MIVKPAVATIGGTDYFIENGVVRETFLGKEDHGIWTFNLDMYFPGYGQAAGNYNLSTPENFSNAVKGMIEFADAYTGWESIKGKDYYVLREEERGLIKGLMNKSMSRYILFGEWEVKNA